MNRGEIMTDKELTLIILSEERRLRVGGEDFVRRHNEIMKEIERIKSIGRNTGKYNEE